MAHIDIRQNLSNKKWTWAVVFDNGHIFSVSDSFSSFDDAIDDVKKHGALAIKRANNN